MSSAKRQRKGLSSFLGYEHETEALLDEMEERSVEWFIHKISSHSDSQQVLDSLVSTVRWLRTECKTTYKSVQNVYEHALAERGRDEGERVRRALERSSVLHEYVSRSPRCSELLDLWHAAQNKYNHDQLVVDCLEMIEAVLFCNYYEHTRHLSATLARSIVRDALSMVYALLSKLNYDVVASGKLSQSNMGVRAAQVRAVLRVMRGCALQHVSVARALLTKFAWQHRCVAPLLRARQSQRVKNSAFAKRAAAAARQRAGDDDDDDDDDDGKKTGDDGSRRDVRTHYLNLVLALLAAGDGELLADATTRATLVKLLHQLLADADHDTFGLSMQLFRALDAYVLSNDRVPRAVKTEVFGGAVFELLSRKILQSSNGVHRNLNKLLIDVAARLCSSTHGVAYRDRSWSASLYDAGGGGDDDDDDDERHVEASSSSSSSSSNTRHHGVRNRNVLRFMLNLAPTECAEQADLVVSIVGASPELLVPYLAAMPFAIDARESMRWVANMHFVQRVLLAAAPPPLGATPPRSVDFLIDNVCGGSALSRVFLARGLQHRSPVVALGVFNMLLAMLRKFEALLARVPTAPSTLWAPFTRRLCDAFRRRIVDCQLVLKLCSQLAPGGGGGGAAAAAAKKNQRKNAAEADASSLKEWLEQLQVEVLGSEHAELLATWPTALLYERALSTLCAMQRSLPDALLDSSFNVGHLLKGLYAAAAAAHVTLATLPPAIARHLCTALLAVPSVDWLQPIDERRTLLGALLVYRASGGALAKHGALLDSLLCRAAAQSRLFAGAHRCEFGDSWLLSLRDGNVDDAQALERIMFSAAAQGHRALDRLVAIAEPVGDAPLSLFASSLSPSESGVDNALPFSSVLLCALESDEHAEQTLGARVLMHMLYADRLSFVDAHRLLEHVAAVDSHASLRYARAHVAAVVRRCALRFDNAQRRWLPAFVDDGDADASAVAVGDSLHFGAERSAASVLARFAEKLPALARSAWRRNVLGAVDDAASSSQPNVAMRWLSALLALYRVALSSTLHPSADGAGNDALRCIVGAVDHLLSHSGGAAAQLDATLDAFMASKLAAQLVGASNAIVSLSLAQLCAASSGVGSHRRRRVGAQRFVDALLSLDNFDYALALLGRASLLDTLGDGDLARVWMRAIDAQRCGPLVDALDKARNASGAQHAALMPVAVFARCIDAPQCVAVERELARALRAPNVERYLPLRSDAFVRSTMSPRAVDDGDDGDGKMPLCASMCALSSECRATASALFAERPRADALPIVCAVLSQERQQGDADFRRAVRASFGGTLVDLLLAESPECNLVPLCALLLRRSAAFKRAIEALLGDRWQSLPLRSVELLGAGLVDGAKRRTVAWFFELALRVLDAALGRPKRTDDGDGDGKRDDEAVLRLAVYVLDALRRSGDAPTRLLRKVDDASALWMSLFKRALRRDFGSATLLGLLAALVDGRLSARHCFADDGARAMMALLVSHSRFLPTLNDRSTSDARRSSQALVKLLHALCALDPPTQCRPMLYRLLTTLYRGTRAPLDRQLLQLLVLFERDGGVSLRSVDLAIGGADDDDDVDAAKPVKAVPIQVPGTTVASLAQRSSEPPKSAASVLTAIERETQQASNAIERIDGARMHRSAARFPVDQPLSGFDSSAAAAAPDETLYDPSFFVALVADFVAHYPVDCRKLAECGAVSLCLAALSSRNSSMRKLAGATLSHYLTLAKAAQFRERPQLLLLLHTVRNAIPAPNARLAPLIATFAVEALAIVLRPAHRSYVQVNRVLLSRPMLDVDDVPLFYKMFKSSEVTHRHERMWMMRLLADGLKSSADYKICRRRHVLPLVQSFFDSPIAGHFSRRAAFSVVERAAAIDRKLSDLIEYTGTPLWLATVATNTRFRGDVEFQCRAVDLIDSIVRRASPETSRISRSSRKHLFAMAITMLKQLQNRFIDGNEAREGILQHTDDQDQADEDDDDDKEEEEEEEEVRVYDLQVSMDRLRATLVATSPNDVDHLHWYHYH
jgi:Nucleolar pre-ribosomal-associated protein 1/Ribosome 60S biogenesis N-terminal